jgi:lysophospholipase L1-like esterase
MTKAGPRRRRSAWAMMTVVVLVAVNLVSGGLSPAWAIFNGSDSTRTFGQVQVWVSNNGTAEFNCTGSLIGAEWVLTAGHCVHDVPTVVRIGSVRLGAGEERPVDLVTSRIHPAADVALLHLALPTTHNELVVPYGRGKIFTPSTVTVRGWGTKGEINNYAPASVLQTSTHRITEAVSTTSPYRMDLYSLKGFTMKGDSGSGVMHRGAVCGVLSNSDSLGSLSTAVPTDAVADWISQTSGIGPRATANCSLPDVKGRLMRIMPLGDQIAQGEGSSLFNGFRKSLSDRLRGSGAGVEFAGTQHTGAMVDDRNEGHRGFLIADVTAITGAQLSAWKPNILTINAGTNDMIAGVAPETAPGRLRDVIDAAFAADPDVTVLVSTLVPSTDPAARSRIDQFNATVPLMVEDYQRAGRHVELADMSAVTTGDLADASNPNDTGYAKMADAYFDSAEEVIARGWVADRNGGIEPRDDSPRDLRVMGLGSSTTYGQGSSDGNGYRAVADAGLSDLIDPGSGSGTGTPHVDWVGSVRVGKMADREIEGWKGYILDDIAGKARCAVKAYQPNLVTLLAGGNDMIQPFDPAGAPARLERLIEQITTDSPGATVLVAGMQPFRDPAVAARGRTFTAQIPGIADRLAQRGLGVVYTDISAVQPAEIGPDGIHPTDAGYAKIGQAFVRAAGEALSRGYVRPPTPAPDAASNPCGLKDDGAGGTSQWNLGSGWADHGVIQPTDLPKDESRWLVDINQDGRAELVSVDPSQHFRFWWNSGPSGTGWKPFVEGKNAYAPQAGAVGNALRFGDVDGDGFPDCMVIDLKGGVDVRVWDPKAPAGERMCRNPILSMGEPNSNVYVKGGYDPWPQFDKPGEPLSIDPDSRIRFADVTGGGRADYLVIEPDNTTTAWANLGVIGKQAIPITQGVGWSAPVKLSGPLAEPREIRYADINGDKRADRILITAKGGARAWLNEGPTGRIGTFRDIGRIAADSGLPPKEMQFADMDGDGRADLVRIGWTGVAHAWLNKLAPGYFSTFHP